MSKFTDFPRNTKQTYLRTCAELERNASLRAEQEAQAYKEYTPRQVAFEKQMVA